MPGIGDTMHDRLRENFPPPREEMIIESRSPFQGVRVSNLSPALADQMRLEPASEGVVIVDIANGSLAQRLGFQPGDVVLSVNNQKVARTADLDRLSRQQNRLWRITIKRGGQQMSVELRG